MGVSKCARYVVKDNMLFYKSLGYDGVFITNHFIDGNIRLEHDMPYKDKIEFYCSDYEKGLALADEIGIKVFFGVEMSYGGTDFLVYGLDKSWYLAHPEIECMKKSALLPFLMSEGALVVQAHPFREAAYIDHIRLYPRCVQGVEIINACRTDFENNLAKQYAENYGLIAFAGTDNHVASERERLAGMQSEKRIESEADFVKAVLSGSMEIFEINRK